MFNMVARLIILLVYKILKPRVLLLEGHDGKFGKIARVGVHHIYYHTLMIRLTLICLTYELG
jgi:hypothetical protein